MDVNLLDAIKDKFIFDDVEYVVFKNTFAPEDDRSKLLLIGEVRNDNNRKKIVPIYNEEEYDEVSDYYLSLKSAFLRESE